MSFGLAREIYGNVCWAVDGQTFTAYLAMVKDFRNNVDLSSGAEKYNSVDLLNLQSKVRTVQSRYNALDPAFAEDELVYIVNLNGPITRTGGSSSYGTKDLANTIMFFEALPNVIGGIINADSGGGSTNAVEIIDSTIKNRLKPIVSILEQGAIACSACYGSISGSDYIISDGKNNKVGSLGTMAEFEGVPNKNVDKNGAKTIRMYASKSTMKNNWFEEAVNNDNFEPLVTEMLDPENEIFLGRIKANRPQITDEQMDGSVFRTGDVVGTLIDQIGTMQDAVNKVRQLAVNFVNPNNLTNTEFKNSNINNLITKSMTKAELQSKFPELFQEVFQEGVKSESDRQGAWMAHYETDSAAVIAGIASGNSIDAKSREELLVKASQKGFAKKLEEDSSKPASTEPAGGAEDPNKEMKEFYQQLLK